MAFCSLWRAFQTCWFWVGLALVSSWVVEMGQLWLFTGQSLWSRDRCLPCRFRPGLGIQGLGSIWRCAATFKKYLWALSRTCCQHTSYPTWQLRHFQPSILLGFVVFCLLAVPQMECVFLFLVFLVTFRCFLRRKGKHLADASIFKPESSHLLGIPGDFWFANFILFSSALVGLFF